MPCDKQHPLRPPCGAREHARGMVRPRASAVCLYQRLAERLGASLYSAHERLMVTSCGTFRESSRFKTSSEIEVNPMRKLVTALAAATIVAAGVATPTTADARWRGGWWGPALGGFAVGAIVGSAFARPYYAYPYYGYGYGPYYGYGYPAYYGYAYSYPPYYGYGDRPYFGYYGARY